jgi:hypothetical protein
VPKRRGGEIPHGIVNRQASRRRQEQRHKPSNQEWEAYKSGGGRKTLQERG